MTFQISNNINKTKLILQFLPNKADHQTERVSVLQEAPPRKTISKASLNLKDIKPSKRKINLSKNKENYFEAKKRKWSVQQDRNQEKDNQAKRSITNLLVSRRRMLMVMLIPSVVLEMAIYHPLNKDGRVVGKNNVMRMVMLCFLNH